MEAFAQDILEVLTEHGLLRTMLADNSLAYQLKRLSKEELVQIRQHLELKGLSKLSKQQLADALHAAIIESLPAQLQLIDDLLYEDLRDLVKKNGLVKELREISPPSLILLRQMGLAFTGMLENHGLVLLMPREVLAVCRELLSDEKLGQTVFHNQKVLIACRGLLTYYGAIPPLHLHQMLINFGFAIDADHFVRLLQTTGIGNGYFDYTAGVFHDRRVIDVEELLQAQAEKREYGYHRVSLEQALLAAHQLYLDWTDAHRELFEYLLDEHDLDEEEAADELMLIIFALNNSVSIPTLLMRLEERGIEFSSFADAIDLLTLLDQAAAHTRLWRYLGRTPAEMRELEARPRLRVLPSLSKRSSNRD